MQVNKEKHIRMSIALRVNERQACRLLDSFPPRQFPSSIGGAEHRNVEKVREDAPRGTDVR